MDIRFWKKFILNTFIVGTAIFLFGMWLDVNLTPISFTILILGALILVLFYTFSGYVVDIKTDHKRDIALMNEKLENKESDRVQARSEEQLWKATLIERTSGFPSLIKRIGEYEKIRDESVSDYLVRKKHPARRSAEMVRDEAQRRRTAVFEMKKTAALIEYYESIAPFLVDLKNDFVDINEEDVFREYTEEEGQDPTTTYLTKEEYRKLPSVERNQIALDRFWKRQKSKWLIGRLYERYVGYSYEEQGYDVEYVGIFKGFEDLGRDLICKKDNDIIVIQCKNWAKFRTIYEKHIFQFFGTVFQYKDENPNQNVKAIFYTTTTLSDLARRFANELRIELKENFCFDQEYPSIKCNVSRVGGGKIYHLPFDQQYDKTKIEKNRKEFYCKTVKEAEEAGFRRAFRYRMNKVKS